MQAAEIELKFSVADVDALCSAASTPGIHARHEAHLRDQRPLRHARPPASLPQADPAPPALRRTLHRNPQATGSRRRRRSPLQDSYRNRKHRGRLRCTGRNILSARLWPCLPLRKVPHGMGDGKRPPGAGRNPHRNLGGAGRCSRLDRRNTGKASNRSGAAHHRELRQTLLTLERRHRKPRGKPHLPTKSAPTLKFRCSNQSQHN